MEKFQLVIFSHVKINIEDSLRFLSQPAPRRQDNGVLETIVNRIDSGIIFSRQKWNSRQGSSASFFWPQPDHGALRPVVQQNDGRTFFISPNRNLLPAISACDTRPPLRTRIHLKFLSYKYLGISMLMSMLFHSKFDKAPQRSRRRANEYRSDRTALAGHRVHLLNSIAGIMLDKTTSKLGYY